MGECFLVKPGGALAAGIPEFTYSGDYVFTDEGDKNWRLKLLTSGTLKFKKLRSSVDVFLVGGGASGYNGGGGGGGYTLTQKSLMVDASVDHQIVIGAGGTDSDGSATSAFKLTALGGSKCPNNNVGGSGGSGGGGSGAYDNRAVHGGAGGSDGGDGNKGYHNGGSGQGSTTREFGEESGTLYAGGGGGGGVGNLSEGGAGGEGGGAAGGPCDDPGKSAEPNTGGGGGAGGSIASAPGWRANGSGGSGIVVIRNARG